MIIDVSDSEEDVEHHGIGPINRAPRPRPATPNGVVIPEVLFEKEQEIKMLREKIAQREQEISGRKAAVCLFTPYLPPSHRLSFRSRLGPYLLVPIHRSCFKLP